MEMVSVRKSKPEVLSRKLPVVIIALIILITYGSTEPQFPIAVPAFMPMAVPISIPLPVGIPIPVTKTTEESTTTTTTTTTEKPENISQNLRIFIPWPPNIFPEGIKPFPDLNISMELPPQFPLPLPSSLPIPLPGPPPLMMVPLPLESISNDERASASLIIVGNDHSWEIASIQSVDSSSHRWKRRKPKKRKTKWKNKRFGIHRRHEIRSNNNFKPVYRHVFKSSDKGKKRATNSEREHIFEKVVQVVTGDDQGKPRVLVQSRTVNNAKLQKVERKGAKVVKSGSQRVGLGDKELVFRPPEGRKISNLTVSFRIIR